jgi:uncharacterized protein (TIGR02217 family)
MSNAIFPKLVGLGWPVNRKPYFSTIVIKSAGGQEVRLANYPYPLEEFELPVHHLHGDSRTGIGIADYQQLWGFFSSRSGPWESFLYWDPADNYTVNNALYEGLATLPGLTAGQGQNFIGVGDNSTHSFQLQRNIGGSLRPIYDINSNITGTPAYLSGTLTPPSAQVQVYLNGIPSTSGWSLSSNGLLTFSSAPWGGEPIAVDFGYFKRVVFNDDHLEFSNFMQGLHKIQKIGLRQVYA